MEDKDDRRTYHILIHCVDSYIRLLAAAGGIGLLDRIDGNPKKLCLCQWYVCFLCICMCVHTTEDTNTSMINLFIFAKFAYERPFYHWWPVMHVSVEKPPHHCHRMILESIGVVPLFHCSMTSTSAILSRTSHRQDVNVFQILRK